MPGGINPRRAIPGEPLEIPAATWNALIESLPSKVGARRPADVGFNGGVPACVVTVRNDTGDDLDAFSVLKPHGWVVSAEDEPYAVSGRPSFAGLEPAAATDAVFITIEPIPDEGFGLAVASGVAVVDVNMVSSSHLYAKPTPGESGYLTSAQTGPARILQVSGTGVQRAIVLLGGGGGKLQSDTFNIWRYSWNEETCTITETQYTVTVEGIGIDITVT